MTVPVNPWGVTVMVDEPLCPAGQAEPCATAGHQNGTRVGLAVKVKSTSVNVYVTVSTRVLSVPVQVPEPAHVGSK